MNTAWSVRIQSFSAPYFPAFGLNMKRYCVTLPIQSKCGKIRNRKTPNTDTFHPNVNKRIDFNTHAVGFLGVISTAAPGDGPFISKRSTHNSSSP